MRTMPTICPPGGYLTFGDLYDTYITGANSAFSYSLWVKFDEINSTYHYIIGKAAFESICSLAGRQFTLQVNTGNRMEVQLFGALTGGHRRYQSGSTLAPNTWTHLAFSVQMNQLYQNNINGIKMYINGVAQVVTMNETVGDGLSLNGIDNGSAHLSAGRHNNNQGNPCGTSQYLDGQFDDLRIYGRVITAQEALDLYNEAAPGSGCPSPVIEEYPAYEVYVCPGSGKQVSYVASGDGLTYQWQYSANSVDWFDITDEVEDTYYITQTGQFYRLVITSGCGTSINSDPIQAIAASNNTVNTLLQNGNGTICEGESVTILTQVGQTSTFSWFPGGMTDASVTVSPATSTTYFVNATATVTGCVVNGTMDVTVIPAPTPTIMEDNATLTVNNGPFASYQWYLDGEIIPNADQSSYTPVENGDYTVMVNDGTCDGTSAAHTFNGIVTGIEDGDKAQLEVSPNPFTDAFIIEVKEATVVSMFNVLGEEVLSLSVNGRTTIETESLRSGIYFLRSGEDAAVIRLVKH
jgi:hypothetical protein